MIMAMPNVASPNPLRKGDKNTADFYGVFRLPQGRKSPILPTR